MKAIHFYFLAAVLLFAGEVPEDVRTASPDGAFRVKVVNVGETNTRWLEIESKDGKLIFTSPSESEGTVILDFYPEDLRWSPDSRVLAISAGFPKLLRTYLFAWDGRRFRQITMPEIAAEEENPWISPV